MNLHSAFLLASASLSCLIAAGASAQQPRTSPRAGLLVLADHDTASEEAARACELQARGSGAAIQSAHTAWRAEHHAAQQALLQSLRDEAGAARSDNTLALFRAASLDKLKQSMAAMDADQRKRFCQDYPGQYATPEMDFTTLHLRERSGPRR